MHGIHYTVWGGLSYTSVKFAPYLECKSAMMVLFCALELILLTKFVINNTIRWCSFGTNAYDTKLDAYKYFIRDKWCKKEANYTNKGAGTKINKKFRCVDPDFCL